ncbi:FadR/GntR family transcriptional regulator [Pseudonocardia halophobica]|uniref:FadR/GntR family transcriptional regulator n=1 Tax=Pseudonocardia halophobica TaxID=29401 RepID=UPI003D940435
MRFDGIAPEQVFAAQRALAPRLVRRATERLTPRILTAMDECVDRMERYIDQGPVFEAEARRFHDLLSRGAESPVLAILVAAVESVLDGLRDDVPVGDARRSPRTDRVEWNALHRKLQDALVAKDGDAASAATVALVDLMVPGASGNRRGVRGATRALSARTA